MGSHSALRLIDEISGSPRNFDIDRDTSEISVVRPGKFLLRFWKDDSFLIIEVLLIYRNVIPLLEAGMKKGEISDQLSQFWLY